MAGYVLDANATISFLTDRPASEHIGTLLRAARHQNVPLRMSVVNWGEVVYFIWRTQGADAAARLPRVPFDLSILILDATLEDAMTAARLKAVYKLPYADSFAAALAVREKATLVTSDPDFKRLGKLVPVKWVR